jgi:predicted metal-dependent enzyme (double-stranded beta helix superfamily)
VSDAATRPVAEHLSMAEFVARMRRLTEPLVDAGGIQKFLGTHLIEPASLRPYLRFEPDRYARHLVFKSSAVELLVLCWACGSRAPIHGHEGELCWARVERGRLRFTSYRELSRSPLRLAALGDPLDGAPGHVDGPADIHAVETVGDEAVSLHVYVKPYEECDIYDVARGEVRRVRLSYDSVPDSPVAP